MTEKADAVKKKSRGENSLPLYLFHQGTNYNAYRFMGAHFSRVHNADGVIFRVWAPNAEIVSVVGDFNGWNITENLMTRISEGGVFETFIEGLKEFDNYKYAVTHAGETVFKAIRTLFMRKLRRKPLLKYTRSTGICGKTTNI